MMAQSVKAQAARMVVGSSSASIKGKQSGNYFDQLLQGSSKINTETKSSNFSAVKKTSVQSTDNSDNNNESSNLVSSQKNIVQNNNTKTETQEALNTKLDSASETSGTAQTQVNTDEEESAAIDQELLAQVNVMLQSIQEAVMKTLNLSPEEFNQLLNDQGMSISDLLQPENLQQFILAGNSENDLMAALTNESLADAMKQLIETVNEIKEESGIGLTEEQIKSLLAQAKLQEGLKNQEYNTSLKATQLVIQAEDQFEQSEVHDTVSTDDKNGNNVSEKNEKTSDTSNSQKDVTINSLKEDKQSQARNASDREADDKAADRFQTFVDNLANSSQSVQANTADDMSKLTQIREIASQIIERIKVSVKPDSTSMELQLNPEHLGKVNLTVQSKAGVLTAHFIVQNEISKEAIESQMLTLRENLNQQGIKVEAIEVTVSANAFEQNSNQENGSQSDSHSNRSGRQVTLEEAINMSEVPVEELEREDATGVRGSLVDYTA